MSKAGKIKSLGAFGILFNSNKAFTLAEVLITLGIIGVVAVLVIPVLIGQSNDEALVTQFKKVQSEIAQAYKTVSLEYGEVDTWANGSQACEYMKSAFKVSKDCCLSTSAKDCFAPVTYKRLSGDDSGPLPWPESIQLLDGASLHFETGTAAMNIFADINGGKGPNQFGVDTFVFVLKKNYPIPTYPRDWMNSPVYCRKSDPTTWTYAGASCSKWIMRTGNMEHTKRDLTAAEWGS